MTISPPMARPATFRVVDRVTANLAQMPAAMVKIAEVVAETPSAPLSLSITELAERAGTSAATVTRFCRLLGYAGYVQFRVALASDLGAADAHETWQIDIGRQFAPEDTPSDVLRSLHQTHTRSLDATVAMIDLGDLERIAAAIWACRHLDIYGVGSSSTIARELQSRLYRIGVNTHAWDEPHGGLASAAIQDADCVAIGVSNSGTTEETIEMLTQAGSQGALTVAITSSTDVPVARIADLTVVAATPEPYMQPGDLSAKPAQLLVLDLLYLLVAQQDFATTATRLSASRMAVSGHRRQAGRSKKRSTT